MQNSCDMVSLVLVSTHVKDGGTSHIQSVTIPARTNVVLQRGKKGIATVLAPLHQGKIFAFLTIVIHSSLPPLPNYFEGTGGCWGYNRLR